MDIRKIKKLMEMLEDSELTELEINEGEESIRLSKEKAPQLPIDLSKAIQVSNDSIGNNQNITNNTLTTIESTHEELDYGEATKSPMVGTYYSSPDPNSQPYVEVGSKVKVGDTLCVIEAQRTIAANLNTLIRVIHRQNQLQADDAPLITTLRVNSGDLY